MFTPGTDVHNAEYVRVIMWPHLKKVPLGSYAPYVIALLDFLSDPESETQLPDWLVSLLRKRGILNLPRHIEGLNCEQDEQGMWYLGGDDLEFIAMCGVTIACDGAWPTRRNSPVGHTVRHLVITT